jgi:predicted outer membrane protein
MEIGMRHSTTSTRTWLSIAIIVSLTGAACGDDDTGSDQSSQSYGGSGGSGGSGKAGSGGSGSARAGTGGSKSGGAGGSTTLGGSGGSVAAEGGSGGRSSGTAGRGSANGGRGGATSSSGGTGGPGTAAGGGTGGTGGSQAAVLTDAQIASVLSTANEGEVQQNTVAVGKATTPEVRALAQELIDMHTAAQTRLNALLTTLNVTAADNDVSQQLRAASLRVVSTLQSVTGPFDLPYLQSQIDVHIQVLNLIDQTLLPSAQSLQLRSELAVVRGEVASHLAQARALAAALMLDVDAGTIDVDGGI